MKKLLLFMILPLFLLAYSDSDLDGVEDKDDLCPKTTLVEIVDDTGCTIERLIAPTNSSASYDIVVGAGYAKNSSNNIESKTTTQSLQLDYFYKKISLQLQSSHFKISSDNYNESGMTDTYLGGYYRFSLNDKIQANFGAKLNIPTYKSDLDNNNLDYSFSLSFSYRMDKTTLFFGTGYTFINDDDIDNEKYKLTYQNTLNYNLGIGYYLMPQLYMGLSYLNTQSTYKGSEDIDSLSFYGHYGFDAHWFSTFGYTKGLSDGATDRSLSLRVGYYF